jgi:glycosyltransferase involved in cell wall biosynthesis
MNISQENMLDEITPLILTYNEAPNIGRTLQQLTWAKQIVVIDSYSTDETLEILDCYSQVKIFQRKFDTFAQQCNYGLTKIETEWVLSLDADYILSRELIQEMKKLTIDPNINSHIVKFKYCVYGKPLRGTLYPPRKVLYRTKQAIYREDGHAHHVEITGESADLKSYIFHDDRKPLSRWLWAQDRYMILEAQKLLKTPSNQLSWGDRLRKTKILAPWVILFYCLLVKGCLFDGWEGWYYTLQRVLAEVWLAIRLMEDEKLLNG